MLLCLVAHVAVVVFLLGIVVASFTSVEGLAVMVNLRLLDQEVMKERERLLVMHDGLMERHVVVGFSGIVTRQMSGSCVIRWHDTKEFRASGLIADFFIDILAFSSAKRELLFLLILFILLASDGLTVVLGSSMMIVVLTSIMVPIAIIMMIELTMDFLLMEMLWRHIRRSVKTMLETVMVIHVMVHVHLKVSWTLEIDFFLLHVLRRQGSCFSLSGLRLSTLGLSRLSLSALSLTRLSLSRLGLSRLSLSGLLFLLNLLSLTLWLHLRSLTLDLGVFDISGHGQIVLSFTATRLLRSLPLVTLLLLLILLFVDDSLPVSVTLTSVISMASVSVVIIKTLSQGWLIVVNAPPVGINIVRSPIIVLPCGLIKDFLLFLWLLLCGSLLLFLLLLLRFVAIL